MQEAKDTDIFDYAKSNRYTILSKDSDFLSLHYRFGAPPKILILRTGNTSTDFLIEYFTIRLGIISDFLDKEDLLELI